jgi:mannose-1-phosphate guanylyltransferase
MAPLTDKIPKPLLPVLNCPLLWWSLVQIHGAVGQLLINTHHLHAAFEPLEAITREMGISFSIVREARLSGPFGGVLACCESADPACDVLVLAGDGYYDTDFKNLLNTHRASDADLTIGVARVQDGSRYGLLTVDDEGRVTQMLEKPPRAGPTDNASCGVYVVSPEVIARFAGHKSNLDWVDVVQVLVAENANVRIAQIDAWHDAGTPKDLLALNLVMLSDNVLPAIANRIEGVLGSVWTQGKARVSRETRFDGAVLLGSGAIVEPGVSLGNTVVGTGAHICSEAKLTNAVILPGACVPPHTLVSDAVWS